MENENAAKKPRGFKGIELLFCLLLVLLFVIWSVPGGSRISEKGNITKGISNCRQVIMSLRIYADDHDGKYPDSVIGNAPRNANTAFRFLFVETSIDNEMIFGCPVSPFVPDGNIWDGNGKEKVLEAGENHWAMTAGLDVTKGGEIPLVYENPVKATWPPVWNASTVGTNQRGRAWKNGIIVGLNSGAVSSERLGADTGLRKLSAEKGPAVGLAKERDGKDLFELAIDPVKFPKGEVLDIDPGDG
jgi:hypothetical protein